MGRGGKWRGRSWIDCWCANDRSTNNASAATTIEREELDGCREGASKPAKGVRPTERVKGELRCRKRERSRRRVDDTGLHTDGAFVSALARWKDLLRRWRA
jgi:hypothetical protein